MTPGCLSVRDLRTAFLANGRRDLFAAISKVKILQADPSSYMVASKSLCQLQYPTVRQTRLTSAGKGLEAYPLGRIVKGPNRIGDIHSVSKRVRKGAAFRDRRCDSGFEEIHCDRRQWWVGMSPGYSRLYLVFPARQEWSSAPLTENVEREKISRQERKLR